MEFDLLNFTNWFAILLPPAILFPIYYYIGRKLGIYDSPVGRSSHFKKTVTSAGIIFSLSLFITAKISGVYLHPYFWSGLALLVLVSFVDDLIFVKNSYRFIVQIIAVAMMASVIPISTEEGHFIEKTPIWIGAVIFGVCAINGINFMDGINGMLASNNLVTLLSLAYLNLTLTDANGVQIQFIDPVLIYSMIASVSIFLIYNLRYHAKMFMGDTGSVGLGFITLYMIYMLVSKTGNISYFLLFSVLGIDSGLTVIYKLILKENIFIPHRDFLFKKLVHIGKNVHVKVSLFYASIQLLINAIIIFLPFNKTIYSQISIVFIVVAIQIAVYIYVRSKLTKTRIINITPSTNTK